MGQQLNIKSDRAYAAATALSDLTGESLTAAVITALEERLARERKARDREAKIQRILALGREIKAHMEPGVTSDHAWLYDENGFPK